jgi:microcin C transport system permease protein
LAATLPPPPTTWTLHPQRLAEPGNWAVFAPNPYGPRPQLLCQGAQSVAPHADNWLGTDDRGRDLLAQLIYGFRVSVLFALALTFSGVVLGVITGAIQGFFGGKTDLAFQRFIEIWSSMPELYLLIIFSAVFAPSIALLLVLLSLFGWMGLSDYVRAEFLRNRQLDYVRAARALGVGNWQIMWRHILPNSMTPVVTFLPFRMSGAILALTSLDFLGLGVPPGTPSLGELLSQGKNNIDAWWISLSTFAVLVITLLLLTFMGDACATRSTPERPNHECRARPPRSACPVVPGRSTPWMPAKAHRAGCSDLRVALAARWCMASVFHCAGRKAGAGGRIRLRQDRHRPEPAAPGDGAQRQGQRPVSRSGQQRDLLHMPERAAAQACAGSDIAMIFQEPMTALNPLFTIGEQIAEVLQLKTGSAPAQCAQAAIELIASTGIPEPAAACGAYPHQLSGGQRQRAMIAMALACKPNCCWPTSPPRRWM